MSLDPLMALAARLSTQPATPSWHSARAAQRTTAAFSRPRSYSLSAQEWAELFPEVATAATASSQPLRPAA